MESGEFFSWERFFTHLLVQETKDAYLRYTKAESNDAYLNGRVLESVLAAMEQVGSLLLRQGEAATERDGPRDRAETSNDLGLTAPQFDSTYPRVRMAEFSTSQVPLYAIVFNTAGG